MQPIVSIHDEFTLKFIFHRTQLFLATSTLRKFTCYFNKILCCFRNVQNSPRFYPLTRLIVGNSELGVIKKFGVGNWLTWPVLFLLSSRAQLRWVIWAACAQNPLLSSTDIPCAQNLQFLEVSTAPSASFPHIQKTICQGLSVWTIRHYFESGWKPSDKTAATFCQAQVHQSCVPLQHGSSNLFREWITQQSKVHLSE